MTLRLDWCSHKAAKAACERWHYSGCVPAGKALYCGVWESGAFIGVVIFSRGANNRIGQPFGLEQTEVVELTRVSLAEHHAPVSRIVAIALRMLKTQKLRLCVSYADPLQGHHGGIYQAGGWIYVGRSEAQRGCLIDGKVVHKRTVHSRFGTVKGQKYSDVLWKHKYLMPLDAAMRAQIEPLRKPYPKRPKPSSEAASHQLAEGGAEPTRTLQTSNEQ